LDIKRASEKDYVKLFVGTKEQIANQLLKTMPNNRIEMIVDETIREFRQFYLTSTETMTEWDQLRFEIVKRLFNIYL